MKYKGGSIDYWDNYYFEETGDVHLIYVKFNNSDKKYIYEILTNVKLIAGNMIFVEGRDSQQMVVECATDSFTIPANVARQILADTGADRFKLVLGNAVKEKYVLKEF